MKKFLAALFLLFGSSCFGLLKDSASIIAEIEKYLNDITTFESDFIQIDKYGRGSFGRFFLKRPFLMKIDYKDPPARAIIAKDNKIVIYDRELKEKTITSTYSSPLSFFLERRINLKENLKILYIEDKDDFLSVKFGKKNEEAEGGAITLIFSKNPLTLRKWIIFSNKNDDSFAECTEISLINWKSKHFISDKEFEKFD